MSNYAHATHSPRRHRRSLRNAVRRGFSSLEVIVVVGVTLPLAVGLFFLARAGCRRLFHVIEMLVTWPAL
jgi:hypothetical protein